MFNLNLCPFISQQLDIFYAIICYIKVPFSFIYLSSMWSSCPVNFSLKQIDILLPPLQMTVASHCIIVRLWFDLFYFCQDGMKNNSVSNLIFIFSCFISLTANILPVYHAKLIRGNQKSEFFTIQLTPHCPPLLQSSVRSPAWVEVVCLNIRK